MAKRIGLERGAEEGESVGKLSITGKKKKGERGGRIRITD